MILTKNAPAIRVRRILIIEEEKISAFLLALLLQREGFQVEIATNADAGCHCALSQHFDLLILNIPQSPDSGFDLYRSLRHKGVSTPVLLLNNQDEPNRMLVEATDKIVCLPPASTLPELITAVDELTAF